jgi:hypothetical protein
MLATVYILRSLSLLCGEPDGEARARIASLSKKDWNAVSKAPQSHSENPDRRVANPAPKAMHESWLAQATALHFGRARNDADGKLPHRVLS